MQHVRELLRRRRARVEHNQFVVEGPVGVAEALAGPLPVRQVLVGSDDADSAIAATASAAGVEVLVVRADALERVGSTVTPQPVFAVLERPNTDVQAVLGAVESPGFVFVLDGLADPGNAGTLVRLAEGAGVGAVVAAGDTVDLFGPKCVRASAGSLQRVPTAIERNTGALLTELRARGYVCIGAAASAQRSFTDFDYRQPVALVLGNEAHGLSVSADVLDDVVHIPMAGSVESLNVAMAGTLLAYEVFRQRRA